MGTAKRERQKANRAARIQAAEEAQRQQDKRRSFRNLGLLAAVVVAAVAIIVIFGRRTEDVATTASSTPSTGSTLPGETTVPGATGAGTTIATVPPGPPITGDTPCPAADGSSVRTIEFAKAPPMCIDAAKTYTAKLATTKGDFTIALDAAKAPKTVNNFVVLSRYHYYDGLTFHRVIPDFVVQGGDPLGSGNGGPGYKFEDELPAAASDYQPGVVAMANSGPNTNGSQFYIVLAPDRLAAKYSILGTVTEGFDTTVKALATGDSAGEPPVVPAVINSITITET